MDEEYERSLKRRNQRICDYRERGMTYREIAAEFNISLERARQIVLREAMRKSEMEDEVRSTLLRALERLPSANYRRCLVKRSLTILKRMGVTDLKSLVDVDLAELAAMRNTGDMTVALVSIAQLLAEGELARRLRC